MLAIIIPFFKLKFFEKTLLSVEKQTDHRFKLYIGNDASTEDPADIITKTLIKTNFKYISYAENLGGNNLAAQWERVIDETENEDWLMILGDDDVLDPNIVEEFYKSKEILAEKEINLIKYSQVIIDEDDNVLSGFTQHPRVYSSHAFLEEKLDGRARSSLSEHIFSRKMYAIHKFEKFPLAWHSDDIAILKFSNFKDFLFIADAKLYIRISRISISGQDNANLDKNFASYLYYEELLKNYALFSKGFVHKIIKQYRDAIWRNGFPVNTNYAKIYFFKGDFLKALYSLKTKRALKTRINFLKSQK